MFKKVNKKGFTLIELIIVVAIMAVLVALLAPNVLKYLEKSKVSKDENSLDSVRLAIEAELMDEQLSSYSTTTTSGEGNNQTTSFNGKWLHEIYAAKANNSTDLDALLGYRLFGTNTDNDGDVLDKKFAYGATDLTEKVFSSKAAKDAKIMIWVDGKGGVAVAAVNGSTIVTYNGDPIIVSTKIDLGTFANGAYANLPMPATK